MPFLKTLDKRHGIRISGDAVTVGSDPDSHIPIRPPFTVAPKQFVLVQSGGRYLLQNTDPADRTHVNGKSVSETWLKDGDVIHAGDLAMLYLEEKDEAEKTVPVQRSSTPFQTINPEDYRPEAANADDAVVETSEPEITNYDELVVSTLDDGEAVSTTRMGPDGRMITEPLPVIKVAGVGDTAVRMSATWLVLISITLLYAWSQNWQYVKPLWTSIVGTKELPTGLKAPLLTKQTDEHLRAVQLVATLPPTTFSSVALAEFVSKTRNPFVKERLEKQLVRALSPLVRQAGDLERLSLLDAALPASRVIVVTFLDGRSLDKLVDGVGDTALQRLTLNSMPAVRLKGPEGQMRHVVEVSPGTFIISDISAERLTGHFELALRINQPSGVVAMARQWPYGFMSSVPSKVLSEQGYSKSTNMLAPSPMLAIDFQPLPTATVFLPSTSSDATHELTEKWMKHPDLIAATLIPVGFPQWAEMLVGKTTMQFQAKVSSATLLDDVWRHYFNDSDLMF